MWARGSWCRGSLYLLQERMRASMEHSKRFRTSNRDVYTIIDPSYHSPSSYLETTTSSRYARDESRDSKAVQEVTVCGR